MLAQVVAQRVALSVVRSVAVWCERVFALSEVQEQMRVALGDDSAAASVCQTHEVRLKLEAPGANCARVRDMHTLRGCSVILGWLGKTREVSVEGDRMTAFDDAGDVLGTLERG